MSIVHVSVAIIKDDKNRLLITQRAQDIPHGGLWEVPGGKVEPEETPHEALLREVHEEVGLQVSNVKFLGEIHHTYSEKNVCLHVFQVLAYEGEAKCHDGQLDLRWVAQTELKNFQFPEANHAIIELVEEQVEPGP